MAETTFFLVISAFYEPFWTVGWCPEGDSNSHASWHYHLKIACLPIPPSGHRCLSIKKKARWQALFCRFSASMPSPSPRTGRVKRVKKNPQRGQFFENGSPERILPEQANRSRLRVTLQSCSLHGLPRPSSRIPPYRSEGLSFRKWSLKRYAPAFSGLDKIKGADYGIFTHWEPGGGCAANPARSERKQR